MADLYPPPYRQYHRHLDSIPSHQSYSQMGYPSHPAVGSGSSNGSSEDVQEPTTAKAQDSLPPQKSETKPQATFLTKLYAYVFVFGSWLPEKLTRWWQSA